MLWQTDLSQEKELHLMEKCGGAYMTIKTIVILHIFVTANMRLNESALKLLTFGLKNILTGGKSYES